MVEENKEDKTEDKKEAPAEEIQEPFQKNSTELIDKANEAAERMERANVKREALLVREEALKVESTLGGSAEAGQPAKKVDKDQEAANKLMEATGYGTQS